jgi:DNA excision repair protein ERCC-2
LPSPFPSEHLRVLVHGGIRTRLRSRQGSLAAVVESIAALVGERRGNYLVYLPSYTYLGAVADRLESSHSSVLVWRQEPAMSEAAREAFLERFSATLEQTQVGFAVMGGVFGEGIDLVGDRLIGVVVVGVGLPQVGVEREQMREYFETRTGAGFDHAYLFPGMNRVLQAAGRIIRTATDRGVVMLLDERFREERYRRLFPRAWEPVSVRTVEQVQAVAREFWSRPVKVIA